MRGSAGQSVLIVGGGFAGLQAALNLPRSLDVTLADQTGEFEFLANIHELVSQVKSPESLRLPLDKLVRRMGHRFVRGRVVRIDRDLRRAVTGRGESLGYDALILAIGGVDADFGVPGVGEHAIGFKSVNECHAIGQRLAELADAGRPFEVVVIGGGLEGVETLGEILRKYRNNSNLRVVLVEGSSQLMPGSPSEIDTWIRRACKDYPVQIVTGIRVGSIGRESVTLETGTSLPSDLTIWTGGIAPPRMLLDSGLTDSPNEFLETNLTLQSVVDPDIFAAGDVASFVLPVTKQAYHAMDSGTLAAKNVLRHFAGRKLKAFDPVGKPMLVSFGDLGGFMVLGDKAIQGNLMTLAKEVIFQTLMAKYDGVGRPSSALRLSNRLARAGKRIILPTVTSPRSLLGLPSMNILAW